MNKSHFETKRTSYHREPAIQWIGDVRPSPMKPAIAWSSGICISFPHLSGPSICHSLKPVIINPLKRKQKPLPCNTQGQSIHQIKVQFAMKRRWQAIHLGWKEFAKRQTWPQTYITGKTWLRCLESSVTIHGYNLNTFEHFFLTAKVLFSGVIFFSLLRFRYML